MTTLPIFPNKPNAHRIYLLIALAVIGWIITYIIIQPLANWIAYSLLAQAQGSHLGNSLAFFFYDVPKIILLLGGMIFLISLLRTFFTAEQTCAWLGGKREGVGNVLAAMLGIVTPFCSCSAVPLFIGFVESGIPLGVTFSFLIAAPTINEVAVVMLFGLFGWKVAGLYIVSGLVISIIAGVVIGRLKMERYVEDFVWQMQNQGNGVIEKLTLQERIERSWASVKDIVGKVWLYVVAGIAVGAGIHGYVPDAALAGIMGKQEWWSVPAAVLVGIPLYSNAAGVVPIVSALMEKGASLGTVLAFMMSVVGLSLPEAVILRRVLKLPLLITFFATIALAIIITGYLFNWIL